MNYYEEYDYNKPFSLKVWARMGRFVRPYKKRLALIAALMMYAALVDVLLPLALRMAVNNFIVPGVTEGLWLFTAVVAGLVITSGAGVILFIRVAIWVESHIGRDIRRDSFVHLQELSFTYYNNTPVGYMLARVMSDTQRIGSMVAWGLVDLSWSLLYIVGVFVSMFLLNATLALIVLCTVPPIALATVFFQRRILRLNREARRLNSQITGAMNEGISGARTSKTLVIEDQNSDEFGELTTKLRQKSNKMVFLNGMFLPIVLFIGALATAVILGQGGLMAINEVIPVGTLMAFIVYAGGIFEPIQQIARVLGDFISTQANIERVTALLDRAPDITDRPEVTETYGSTFAPKRENWEELRGDIEFQDVTFMYPDGTVNVLEHFDLNIPAGTFVAIVGETGAGKSTLVNLVCRFFEPTEGRILIDGRDVRDRSQLWLHSHIGYVLQTPHLFSGTVRENIRYGRLDATDDEVQKAAEVVSADRVIAKLPDGMNTPVGEGGDRLSTGEKQLISFARAVLADPRIFVLDEATSSIDTETEALIQQATGHLLRGRTSFVIAHRLSTIKNADIILVVHEGKIIECGNHRELLRQKGHYYALYTRQFEEDIEKKELS